MQTTSLLAESKPGEVPLSSEERSIPEGSSSPVVEATEVRRNFKSVVALDGVSLVVRAGEIHALLGPNGAGKTTLLRVLTGLVEPDSGSVQVAGVDASRASRALRTRVGLVPSGDRSFYLRISGLENLVFFGRMYGMRRQAAFERAREALEQVELTDAARRPVGEYSHGMQKRLSVARALLTKPPVLFVDEATHDLDPDGARRVRELVGRAARGGATVVWATQRLEEIRGFADEVTLLQRGRVRFVGSVPELLAVAAPRHFLLRLKNGTASGAALERRLRGMLAGSATLAAAHEGIDHYHLTLADGVMIGQALGTLLAAEVEILGCTEARAGVEEAFLSLTAGDDA